MLKDCKLMAFCATTNPLKAKHFYQEVLGLPLVEDNPFALVFNANETELRIQKVSSVTPSGYTALGWAVSDIEAKVRELNNRGVACERFAGMPQDELGIWAAPNGSKVAWFRDPDNHILSLAQHTSA